MASHTLQRRLQNLPPAISAQIAFLALRRHNPSIFLEKFITSALAPALAETCRMDTPRFVYVLESVIDPDRHYIGLTADVVKRLRAHNDSRAIHTSKFAPWRLLVAIEFADANCAARFEKFLKTGSGRGFARRHFA